MIEIAKVYQMANLSKKMTLSRKKRKTSRGQSLVELAIVLALLMFMVIAIVEYGFLLNQYLNILDAGREATRQSSLGDPFFDDGTIDENFYLDIAAMVDNFLLPLELDPNLDDVVISFFSVTNGTVVRFPDGDGWSRNNISNSNFSSSDIEARLNTGAPATGVLLVEIFYNYWQTLNLPIFSNVIPNPIPLYNYSVMPLSAAEPTPTP
jgi:hypothetical protein